MNILIIGGTKFVGRHITEAAIAAGHSVTLFHRGHTNPELFPEVNHILGDRMTDLSRAATQKWDAVIDMCAYFPRHIDLVAESLSTVLNQYVLISTISVYQEAEHGPLTEDAPVIELADPTVETVTRETYGGLKVLCERAALKHFGPSTLIARPGLIVGPHDHTDRFTYWPVRVHRGGDVLVPMNPAQPTQFIDGRDLAAWTIQAVERKLAGTYNTIGPGAPMRCDEFLSLTAQTINPRANLIWVDPDQARKLGVEPGPDFPFWLGESGWGIFETSAQRAVDAGMVYRPTEVTIKDTLEYWQSKGEPNLIVGVTPEREQAWLSQPR